MCPVSSTTRTRVMRAVREMDYVADARAKAVAGVGTPTPAFVLEGITGPSFAHMARGGGARGRAARAAVPGLQHGRWPAAGTGLHRDDARPAGGGGDPGRRCGGHARVPGAHTSYRRCPDQTRPTTDGRQPPLGA
ncbi:hypothetical protein ACWDZ8_13315 [Streptomyces sp. NPDC003233]